MNRRAFLQPPLLTGPIKPPKAAAELVSPYANKTLPARTTTSTLAPYAGTWGAAQAAHLLRRCLLGPTRGEIQAAAASTLTATLNTLLTPAATPALPLNVSATDTTVAIGQTWVGQTFDQTLEGVRRASLRDWWLGLQLNQGTSLTEKMTLFWHNHFVVEFGDINSAFYGYEYVRLLRQHALG
ncbi:MAG: DUF1800 family protein, partial [Hymenobacter sp.]